MAQSRRQMGSRWSSRSAAAAPDDETLATVLKDMWSQIGVEVTITPTEGTTSTMITTTEFPGNDQLLDQRHHRSG